MPKISLPEIKHPRRSLTVIASALLYLSFSLGAYVSDTISLLQPWICEITFWTATCLLVSLLKDEVEEQNKNQIPFPSSDQNTVIIPEDFSESRLENQLANFRRQQRRSPSLSSSEKDLIQAWSNSRNTLNNSPIGKTITPLIFNDLKGLQATYPEQTKQLNSLMDDLNEAAKKNRRS